MSKRQAFSFFVSYYEVAKELSEKEKLAKEAEVIDNRQ